MVQRLRKGKNWSQEYLAGEIGVDRSYISSLERGLRNPTLRTIIEISALFETDLVFAGKSIIE
ncbi:helix-turn-helix transcriptional regulator [bacterium]|nr:helix-turn-helix transcriptional regulator [bacterium]